MKKIVSSLALIALVASVVTTLIPSGNLPTLAAAGDWKPNGASVFPHSTGISRGVSLVQPSSSVGASTTEQRITPASLAGGNVFTCDIQQSGNQIQNIDNAHYFPDGIAYSSFNNYRNEFTNQPINTFFNSATNDEVERNYLGGARHRPTEQPALGAGDAKDTVNITDISGSNDAFLEAYVHNSASTALNPTGDTDSRSSSANTAGDHSYDLSARAVNTRMHFSIPSVAVPANNDALTVNRLRANNAYHESTGGTSGDPCAGLTGHQISDVATLHNGTAQPITFRVAGAYIENPYVSSIDSSHPNAYTDFSSTGLRALVDPTISQTALTDPRNPVELDPSQGALISSGRSNTGANRNIPNQPGCDSPSAGTSQVCNRFAAPETNGSQFDGQFYGSKEFSRNVYVDLDAVAATPQLSVNHSVRRVVPNEENFTQNGPIATTITGNGDGQVEYQVILQNSGNVDLTNINFADTIPSELTPIYTSSNTIQGIITRCFSLQTATDGTCTDLGYSDIRISGNTILVNSAEMSVSDTNPLPRDPNFITTGNITDGGQVVRIRWLMNSTCAASVSVVRNFAVASARSGSVQANVISTNDTAYPQFTGPEVIPFQGNWSSYFDGETLSPLPTSNETTVELNTCGDITTPHLRIAKYVRRVTPTPATNFGTGSVITNVGSGTVEYSVLIENTGPSDIGTIDFADVLPPELAFVPGSIRAEVCQSLADANATANCPSGGLVTINDSAVRTLSAGSTIAISSSNGLPVDSNNPIVVEQVVRIRWTMTSVCTPYGTTPGTARNYALVFGATSAHVEADIGILPGVGMPQARPYNLSNAEFTALFPDEVGFHQLVPTATNVVNVTRNNCPPPPPPGVHKYVSATARDAGASPASFEDANTEGAAVDFGEQDAPYTTYYRVTVSNTGTVDIPNALVEDRFYFRNGTAVTAQNVTETVGSTLDTRVVNSATSETVITDAMRRVVYVSNTASSNILRFRVPTLRAGETLAFYYRITVNPGTRTGSQVHKNQATVCWPQNTNGTCGPDGGSDLAFHRERPRTQTNPLTLTILKTVNGHDADQASLTAPNDQAAVAVVNGDALRYQVTVTAPSTNNAPVTGIVLSDNVTSLPNVTTVTLIRLTTPTGTCAATCSLTSMSDLATHAFDLAAGQTATLTYNAVARYTSGGTFNQNIARAVPLVTNVRNPAPVQNPATILVRNSGLTIVKTVNGQDADTDNTAVTVNNGTDLNYVVTIAAPAGNAATVTGIVLSDDVLSLPNITNVRTIRLTTPSAPCSTPCTIATIGDLASRAFDLAAGQTATLTYTATGTNTGANLSVSNRNTARATPSTTNVANPGPVSNPATVFVRGTSTPHTDFRITKDASPEVARDGDTVTYTIRVQPRNSSNDEIANLVLLITDDINDTGRLEQGGVTFTYVRGSTRIRTSDASCENEMNDNDGIRCEDVSADDDIRITYRVTVSAPNLRNGDIVVVDNTAVLRDDTPGVTIRDDDDAEVRVIAPPSIPDLPPPSPLEITKNVDRHDALRRGDIVHYTITVHNPNPDAVTRTLTDTIGLNGGTVPGQNGGRVRFNPGSLTLSGAEFSGSIDSPEGMVLVIPADGLVTITYTATSEPDPNQRVISLAPNTARLNTGEYATAFVQLPTTGPAALALIGLVSIAISSMFFLKRKKKA